jgi:signal transduction histidine kinase
LKPKLIIIFLLIVLLPLGLLMWLGVRLAHYEQEAIQRRFQAFLLNQLSDIDQTIVRFTEKRERDLLNLTDISSPNAEILREAARKNPFVLQLFYLDSTGKILYPAPADKLNEAEWDFLERTKEILTDKNLPYQSEQDIPVPPQQYPNSQKLQTNTQNVSSIQSQESRAVAEQQKPKTHGWYIWYWGRGVQLLFWRKDSSGNIIGAELDSTRLLSDVIGILPGTNPLDENRIQGRILLSNTAGETLYQWGTYEPAEDESALVETSVSYPLSAWTLKYYFPPEQLSTPAGSATYLGLVAGLVAVGLALVGLSIYFYRENSREIREAAQRISFVNQVSHELKTPLTNIRMYAELLENSLPDEDAKVQRDLDVIVSESQRLSRLIGNILSFSRKQRNKLTLHLSTGVVDEVVHSVLENFKASFKTHGISVEFDGQAGKIVRFDPDAVEQILGNLFNNVEKYAASGGSLKVESRQENEWTTVTVTDRGPGIPHKQREKIFLPFYRISNKINDGVVGTGIGLSIARDLARIHGGDLVLLPTVSGAVFQLSISTPFVSEEER